MLKSHFIRTVINGVLITISTMYICLPSGRAASVECDAAWCVILELDATFSNQQSAILDVNLTYPAGSDYRIIKTRTIVYIVPENPHTPKPSHVVVSIKALGFKPLEINSGILKFSELNNVTHNLVAETKMEFNMISENTPKVENIVQLNTYNNSKHIFEISIYNPMDFETSITTITINGGYFVRVLCAPPAIIYDININFDIDLNKVVGEAKERSGDEVFSYPITGKLGTYCYDRWFSVEIPFNLPVPAKQRTYIKLRINEGDKIVTATNIISKEHTEEHSIMHKKIIDETFSWDFGFVLNNQLYIRGAYIKGIRRASTPEEEDHDKQFISGHLQSISNASNPLMHSREQ